MVEEYNYAISLLIKHIPQMQGVELIILLSANCIILSLILWKVLVKDRILFPWNSYVEVFIHNVTLFGDGAFRKIINVKWGHNVGALILKLVPWHATRECKNGRRHQRFPPPPSLQRRNKERPRELTMRKWLFKAKISIVSTRNWICWHLDHGHQASRDVRKSINVQWSSHLVCGSLLWQPQQIHTASLLCLIIYFLYLCFPKPLPVPLSSK